MSAIPVDRVWEFLQPFFAVRGREHYDCGRLLVLADWLEEHEDSRAVPLRRRAKSQNRFLARAALKNREMVTNASLHQYVCHLFPEIEDPYEEFLSTEIQRALNSLK